MLYQMISLQKRNMHTWTSHKYDDLWAILISHCKNRNVSEEWKAGWLKTCFCCNSFHWSRFLFWLTIWHKEISKSCWYPTLHHLSFNTAIAPSKSLQNHANITVCSCAELYTLIWKLFITLLYMLHTPASHYICNGLRFMVRISGWLGKNYAWDIHIVGYCTALVLYFFLRILQYTKSMVI